MGHHHEEKEIPVIPADSSKLKGIWKIAGVLALITAVEYVIAFTVPSDGGAGKYSRIVIFVLLTILKAYYIMSYFMHLGHEKLALQLCIVLPLIFLAWLILSQLIESGYVLDQLAKYWHYGK
jgi:caa(3)-type oxidase subunit IV